MSQITPRQSRVIGALVGVHAGDSLGATLEFKTHTDIKSRYPNGLRSIIGGGFFEWPAGHATDDTDMTRGVLLAYRDLGRRRQTAPSAQQQQALARNPAAATEKSNDDVVKMAADYFVDWYNGDWPGRKRGRRPADIGNATVMGLRRYKNSRNLEKAGAGVGNAGNGSLMRCIPTALFQPDQALLVDESLRISRVTHDDPRCTVACAAYNTIAARLIDGALPADAVAAGEAVAVALEPEGGPEKAAAGPVTAAIRRGKTLSIADTARDGSPPDISGKCSGYVLDSLILAVAAVLDPRSFEDVVVDVVRVGHDTDTNGAIAGGLLGSRDGVEAIPDDWREVLQFADEFRAIALELTQDSE